MKTIQIFLLITILSLTLSCIPQAKLVSYSEPCITNCTSPPRQVCICPLDRLGPKCETHRKYECKLTLVSPLKDCKRVFDEKFAGRYIDADPMCIFSTQGELLTFKTSLALEFSEIAQKYSLPNVNFTDVRSGEIYENLTMIMNSFSYFYSSFDSKVLYRDYLVFRLHCLIQLGNRINTECIISSN